MRYRNVHDAVTGAREAQIKHDRRVSVQLQIDRERLEAPIASIEPEGYVTLTLDPRYVALLSGRGKPEDIVVAQAALAEAVAEAWYAAGCPPVGMISD